MNDGIIYDLTGDGVDRMMHFDRQEIPYARHRKIFRRKRKTMMK